MSIYDDNHVQTFNPNPNTANGTGSSSNSNIMTSRWYCLHPQQASFSDVESSAALVLHLPLALPLDNRGLAYGDGFFTTMAIQNGEILWVDYHWQRLDSHASALQLAIPKQTLLLELKSHAKQLEQGVMKVIVTRTAQTMRGYGFSADASGKACEIWLKTIPAVSPAKDKPTNATQTTYQSKIPQTLINNTALSLADGNSITLQTPIKAICLTSKLACLPPTLAGLKTLNRLDNVLASGEFEKVKASNPDAGLGEGLGEGLLRDMSGNWIEGTMSNVFYQLNVTQTDDTNYVNNPDYLTKGQWYTPPMTQSGVAGVMRQVIIDSLATTENPVIIRSLSDDDLPKLTQLFFCNAVRGVMPVASLTLLLGEVVELSL